MTTPPDIASQLAAYCAPQIEAIRTHPWIVAASRDKLRPDQIGSWATQDLLWPITAAYEYGFTNPTPSTQAALTFLEHNNIAETAFLEATSKDLPNAPNADITWPGFLGYGAWGSQVAELEVLPSVTAPHPQALTVVWVAEYAYNQAWHVIKAGNPSQPQIVFGTSDWAAPGFDQFVKDLSAGLNEAAAAVPGTTLEELQAIAVQGFRWEAAAWTASYELTGWDNPDHDEGHGKP